jgi:Single-strand binding protein family
MKNEAKATICGQLGADIMIRDSKKGKKYGILTVAVNRSIKDRETNEFVTRTDWFKIHVWSKSILENSADLLKKGTPVSVNGGDMRIIRKPLVIEGEVVGRQPFQTINVKRKSDITILKRDFPTIEGSRNSIIDQNSTIEEKVACARSAEANRENN